MAAFVGEGRRRGIDIVGFKPLVEAGMTFGAPEMEA
jgi:hypothetical protein